MWQILQLINITIFPFFQTKKDELWSTEWNVINNGAPAGPGSCFGATVVMGGVPGLGFFFKEVFFFFFTFLMTVNLLIFN